MNNIKNTYVQDLVIEYKKRGVFLDTGVLLLYIVGSKDLQLIKRKAETCKYDENDFIALSSLIEYFERVITTPQVLTETSDLLGENRDFHKFLKTFILRKETTEIFKSSEELANCESFLKFGIADSSTAEVSRNSYLVLTTDNRFLGYLIEKKFDVIALDVFLKAVKS
jgi:predicted nucleic acid-binding protein